MKLNEIKQIIAQVIAEAKENGALPKSGGKLVHLKKELASLKSMQESVSQLTMNEANSQPVVAEYAHMQKYVNELEKIKMASAKLSEMLGNQIGEVEGKIEAETQKIKEMMGLIEPAPKKEAKAKPAKAEKEESKKAEKKEEIEEAFTLSGGGAGSGSQTMSSEPEDAYLQKFANLKVGDKVKYEVKRGWSGDVVQIERVGEIVKINPSTIVIGSYKSDGTLSEWPIPKKQIAIIKKLKS
jgi:cell fate (sporulation/competence/biofilm development) regulator YmcA (YheA/YmcA/DUF963 family)